jgi:hypothetical protein
MKVKVARADVWAATIEDRPGGLAGKLRALAEAGANLEFVIARRAPDRPGTGVVFVAPVKGVRQTKAAAAVGFAKAKSLHSVRIEGADKPGIGACVTAALAGAGINLRGLSAAAIGKRFVLYLAVDSAATAAKAQQVVRRMK